MAFDKHCRSTDPVSFVSNKTHNYYIDILALDTFDLCYCTEVEIHLWYKFVDSNCHNAFDYFVNNNSHNYCIDSLLQCIDLFQAHNALDIHLMNMIVVLGCHNIGYLENSNNLVDYIDNLIHCIDH